MFRSTEPVYRNSSTSMNTAGGTPLQVTSCARASSMSAAIIARKCRERAISSQRWAGISWHCTGATEAEVGAEVRNTPSRVSYTTRNTTSAKDPERSKVAMSSCTVDGRTMT
jgi:hypothetical protein